MNICDDNQISGDEVPPSCCTGDSSICMSPGLWRQCPSGCTPRDDPKHLYRNHIQLHILIDIEWWKEWLQWSCIIHHPIKYLPKSQTTESHPCSKLYMYINTFNFDNRHLKDLCLGVATILAIAVLHHTEHKIEVTRIVSYTYYFQYAYRMVSQLLRYMHMLCEYSIMQYILISLVIP